MASVYGMAEGNERAAQPVLRKIDASDVFDALRLGYRDFLEKPSHTIFIIIIYPIMGAVIGVWTSGSNILPLLFPLITGFALVGPIAAIGLYEISRRRESGRNSSWRHAFGVLRSPSIGSILTVAVLLAALFVAWLFSAQAIYDRFFGNTVQTSLFGFLSEVLTTAKGWKLIILGNTFGFCFALAVLSIAIVSFPLLLERKVGAMVAVDTSVRAMAMNRGPVLLWGLIVAALLLLGSLPLFAGLAVVLPILGHATWHLYRKLVVPPTETQRHGAQS